MAKAVAVTASVIKVATSSSAPHPFEPKPSNCKLAIDPIPVRGSFRRQDIIWSPAAKPETDDNGRKAAPINSG
ncbi:hypothetical protein thsrh120_30010 [Rhizobium sp. No.120]